MHHLTRLQKRFHLIIEELLHVQRLWIEAFGLVRPKEQKGQPLLYMSYCIVYAWMNVTGLRGTLRGSLRGRMRGG